MPFLKGKPIKTYYPVTEEQLKRGKMNAFDMSITAGSLGLSRGEGRMITDNTIISIDATLLMPKIGVLPRYSSAIYFYLLSNLKDNRKAIKIHNTRIRNAATNLTVRKTFETHLTTLLESGLVFRFNSHEFYINPLYAWVGDRSQYFDIDRLPFKASDVCVE